MFAAAWSAASKGYHGSPCLTSSVFGLQINERDLITLQLMLSLQLMLPVAGCGARVGWDLMAPQGEWLIEGEEAVMRGVEMGVCVWGYLGVKETPLFVARSVSSEEVCEARHRCKLTPLKASKCTQLYEFPAEPVIKQSESRFKLMCFLLQWGWAWRIRTVWRICASRWEVTPCERW